MEKKTIAIFGGSFNPPLNSHLMLAKQILETDKNIRKLYFVPVSTKYNKNGLEKDEHRYNMLKLMCQNEKNIEVSNIELIQERQFYTIETLNIFKNKFTDYDICFVTGADNLKEISTWKRPEDLLKNFKIIALERGEERIEDIIKKDDLLKKYKSSIIIFNNTKIDFSSTQVRNKLKKEENVDKFLNKDVLEYIRENNLYI